MTRSRTAAILQQKAWKARPIASTSLPDTALVAGESLRATGTKVLLVQVNATIVLRKAPLKLYIILCRYGDRGAWSSSSLTFLGGADTPRKHDLLDSDKFRTTLMTTGIS